MGTTRRFIVPGITAATLVAAADAAPGLQDDPATNSVSRIAAPSGEKQADSGGQYWNWHVQSTFIVQGDPAFPAQYSGPNSLDSNGEIRETFSLDLMGGARLWHGAEGYADALVWQGFGLSKTLGVDGFPNGEAFRLGDDVPNINMARLFVRQTIGLGGEEENVEDDQFQLAGKRDISRFTVTVGKMSVKDIFDNNTYANDDRTQFMNWALMAKESWDYPADSLG